MKMAVMSSIAIMSLLICLGVLLSAAAAAAHNGHRYKVGDPVHLYANVIGPFDNPSETYHYSDLPLCSSENMNHRKETLGEMLNGDRLVDATYKLYFRVSHNSKLLCKKKLTKDDVAQFRKVIDKNYYFEMYFDDLPLWGVFGAYQRAWEKGPKSFDYLLFTHIKFYILYNDDHVIEIIAHMGFDGAIIDITEDREIEVNFSYSVLWNETSRPFEKRMENYVTPASTVHHHEFQWFSTMNSCVMVVLLTGFLAIILVRVLKNELIRYNNDMESVDGQDDAGWKHIRGDVFRFPENKLLFTACVGSGTQILAITFLTFITCILGIFHPYNRGTSLAALLVTYTLTSVIAGYSSASLYFELEGTNWVSNILLAGGISQVPLLLTFCFLKTVAMVYGATAALPFGTIVIIVLTWILVTFPLTLLGGIAGKNRNKEFQAPCHTRKCPREIPLLPWYRRTIPQMAITGFLPFSAICIELYHIFGILWAHRVYNYTMYIIFIIVFIILLTVVSFITVALTYFQLAAEDHQWWWRSFLCGGSTSLYIFGYCFYYYFTRTNMSGFMQASFFFGYMACICYGFFLMLGTVGFYASLSFVRHIYGSIKCD